MNFFLKKNIKNKKLVTRFAPEPNGGLHLGHLKCIYINNFISKYSNGNMILRFDDTNPINCSKRNVYKIIRDIKKLGIYKKIKKISFTSNYFKKLIYIAKIFIKSKIAYIEYKNLKILSVKKNAKIFKMMQMGKIKEKKAVLKSNILTLTKNYNTKLNIMFRIIKKKHFLKKNVFIYPTYNFSHCMCDFFENIDISLCTKEFENNKFFYYWYLKKYTKVFSIKKYKLPKQIEFSKLKIKNVPLSKRKILKLKNKKNLMTINSLIKRGIKYKYLIKFCKTLSFSKKESVLDFNTFNKFIIKSMLKDNIKTLYIIYKPRIIFIKNKRIYIDKNTKKSKKINLFEDIICIKVISNNIIGKKNAFKEKKFFMEKKMYNLKKKNEPIYINNIGFFKKKGNRILEEIITY
ncbi:glutamate--tRNA ligase family protein [Candidatus Vidania fulgoroideorum]